MLFILLVFLFILIAFLCTCSCSNKICGADLKLSYQQSSSPFWNHICLFRVASHKYSIVIQWSVGIWGSFTCRGFQLVLSHVFQLMVPKRCNAVLSFSHSYHSTSCMLSCELCTFKQFYGLFMPTLQCNASALHAAHCSFCFSQDFNLA